MGPLAEPKTPPLEGLDAFEGETFHSARWNHDYDLKGKRVAAVGTGASAIQFVPEIQKDVAQLHVIQRTPPWIMPHPNRSIRRWEARLYERFPLLQKLVRGIAYSFRELLVLGFVKHPRLMELPERIARRHMRRQISDAALLEKVSPSYTIGCKRILPSNQWYRALSRAQRRVADGRRREGDGELGRDRRRRGARGRRDHLRHRLSGHRDAGRADRARAGRQDARRGLAGQPEGAPRDRDAGLPQPVRAVRAQYGPRALLDGLHDRVAGGLRDGRAALTWTATAPTRCRSARTRRQRFNADLDERMQGTVWNTGCASWYLDATGRNSMLWPDWTWRFRQRTASFDPDDFELTQRTAGDVELVVAWRRDRVARRARPPVRGCSLTQPSRAHDHACDAIGVGELGRDRGHPGCEQFFIRVWRRVASGGI